MSHHRRRRPKSRRAGCNCGGKLAKNARATRRGRVAYGGSGSERRLTERRADIVEVEDSLARRLLRAGERLDAAMVRA